MGSDKKESCGLFGIYGDPDAVQKTYYGLYSLQHRGQESAGIASTNGDSIQCATGTGTVGRVFRKNNRLLARLSNPTAIGHVRYSTTGSSSCLTVCWAQETVNKRAGITRNRAKQTHILFRIFFPPFKSKI